MSPTLLDLLGAEVRDVVSGFAGRATGVALYEHRSATVLVEAPTGNGDAKTRWLDAERLVRIVDPTPPGQYA